MSEADEERWDEIVQDLADYRNSQHEVWGEVDDVLLAKYVAGTADSDERRTIERLAVEKPAIRELIDTVRQVLRPAWLPGAAAAGPQASHRAGTTVIALNDALRTWVDAAGELAARGMELFRQFETSPTYDLAMGPDRRERTEDHATWSIPLSDDEGDLVVRAEPADDGRHWSLAFELVDSATPLQDIRVALIRPDGAPEMLNTFDKVLRKRIQVPPGAWQLQISVGAREYRVALQLGVESSES